MANNHDASPIWLLLLPCPPSDVSLSMLRVAYGPGLTQALKHASTISLVSSKVVLDVTVFYDDDFHDGYSNLQRFFGVMYILICVICTEQQIDLQYGNDVDARLTLCRKPPGRKGHPVKGGTNDSSAKGPFSDLKTLATIDRSWKRVLCPEGEMGEELLQSFLQIRNKTTQYLLTDSQVERLPGGLVFRQSRPQDSLAPADAIQHHDSVAVGGTFDHLHAGHKLLLTMTALVLNSDPEASTPTYMTVGITGDELLKSKKFRDQLEDFYKRQSVVQYFLLGVLELISPRHVLETTKSIEMSAPFGREVQNTLRSGLTIRYVEIFDPCGPTITDEAISALVLSAETRSGGKVVNDNRRGKGWSALEIFEVDVLDTGEDESSHVDGNFQSKISSTDIRRRVHEKIAATNGKY